MAWVDPSDVGALTSGNYEWVDSELTRTMTARTAMPLYTSPPTDPRSGFVRKLPGGEVCFPLEVWVDIAGCWVDYEARSFKVNVNGGDYYYPTLFQRRRIRKALRLHYPYYPWDGPAPPFKLNWSALMPFASILALWLLIVIALAGCSPPVPKEPELPFVEGGSAVKIADVDGCIIYRVYLPGSSSPLYVARRSSDIGTCEVSR